MILTRRDTGRLILAGGAALALPQASFAAQSELEWSELLQIDLNNHLRCGCGGEFKVVRFGARLLQGRTTMDALIRLDWPPGMRQRRFEAIGGSVEATYRDVLGQALREFGNAWPVALLQA